MPRRREFLAGLLAGGGAALVPLPARGLATASSRAAEVPAAGPEVVRRGRAIAATRRGDLLVVAHAQRRTVAIVDRLRSSTTFVELDGQPLEVAVAPDGRIAAVTTAFWQKPGLTLIDLSTGAIRGQIDVGPAPGAVAFTRRGLHLIVAGGEQDGAARIVDVAKQVVVGRVSLGRVPRGVAVGNQAWIALNGEDAVVAVDPRGGRVTTRLEAPPYPDALALSPDQKRLLVGHRGGTTELRLADGRQRHLQTGRHPSAVAYTRNGTRLIALGSAAEVLSIDRRGHRRHRAVDPGPRGLAVVGERAFTVSVVTGAVSGVRA